MLRLDFFHSVIAAAVAGGCVAFATSGALAVGDTINVDTPPSLSGSYLAARSADIARDIDAAETFYSETLASDPDNPLLVDRLLPLRLAKGEIDEAMPLAEKMVAIASDHPIARLALTAQAIKQRNDEEARANLDSLPSEPLSTLTAGLVGAWVDFDEGKTDEALARIDALSGPDWYPIFKDYHTALILDAAGRVGEAADFIAKAYTADNTALRIVDAYASIMARAGRRDDASKAIDNFQTVAPMHPLINTLDDIIQKGDAPPPIAETAAAGAAEVLYGLGSAIGLDRGIEPPILYLQLANYLDPRDYLPSMAIGDLQQAAGLCDKAIAIYETVPSDAAVRRSADIQIGNCLAALDQFDAAADKLKQVVDDNPGDFEAAVELGNVYRANDQFALAADAYDIAINAIGDPDRTDWRLYYFRGISEERTKRWDEAEADFKQALEIEPEQPLVMNYLGYSWVDMGMNLEPALDLIKRAVDLRPNDGYVVDSLGWAYYRLGRYDEAVDELETAIELRPEDPVINDHLGDAYWKVDRKREAMFQWAHARDLEPAPEELPKILDKLQHGLRDDQQADDAVEMENSAVETEAPQAVAAVDAAAPAELTIKVREGESLSAIAERIFGNADAYTRILDANRDRITDPNLIYPGMTLRIPTTEAN